jgi:RHS repeat-associated protein
MTPSTASVTKTHLHLPRSTGKELDTESGNDYFEARYYSSSVGRFLSPDWSAKVEPVPYAKLDDPQSLNLYAYVQNNPMG